MKWSGSTGPWITTACAVALCAAAFVGVSAQAPAPAPAAAPAGRAGGFGGRGGVGGLFTAADADKDGCISRAELKTAFDNWYLSWDKSGTSALTQDQIAEGVTAAMAPPPAVAGTPAAGAGGASVTV